jgi:phage protein U
MYLGSIAFDLMNSPEAESRDMAHSYSEQKPAYGKAVILDRGPDLDTMRFSFTFHRAYGDPKRQLSKLETACEKGQVLPLTYTNGDYPGDYVVKNVRRGEIKTDGVRNWISVSGDMELLRAPASSVLIRQEPKDRGDTVQIAESSPEGNAADVTLDNLTREG